jgi:hypothetical protein
VVSNGGAASDVANHADSPKREQRKSSQECPAGNAKKGRRSVLLTGKEHHRSSAPLRHTGRSALLPRRGAVATRGWPRVANGRDLQFSPGAVSGQWRPRHLQRQPRAPGKSALTRINRGPAPSLDAGG